MPTKPRNNSEKIDLVYTTVKKHSKDIAALKTQISGLDQRQQRFEERQDRFEENQKRSEENQKRFEENQKRFEESLLKRLAEVQLEFLKGLSDLKKSMWELYSNQDHKIQRAIEANEKFKDGILTTVDHVAKMFDDFNLEKKALGLKQDRLEATQNRMEAEIETLQKSEEKQNGALAKIEVRVEALEAKER